MIFIWLFLFRGTESLEPRGRPRFWRAFDDSFAAVFTACPAGTSIRAGTFAAAICDLVTLAASVNASGN